MKLDLIYLATLLMCLALVAPANDKKDQKPLYWVAPMDSDYRREKPGKSPMGMDLVPVYKKQSADTKGVKITSVVQHNLGVETTKARPRLIKSPIRAMGIVKKNANQVAHIHTYRRGWIQKLNIEEVGRYVKKGEIIGSFFSPEIVAAQKELIMTLKNQSEKTLAKADTYHRLGSLKGIKQRLKAFGMAEDQINRIIKQQKAEWLVDIKAPISGTVTELNAKEGMFVDAQTNLMTLTDLKTVWISAQIFSQEAKRLDEGDKFIAYPPGKNNQTIESEIDFISPTADPDTRTVTVRATVANSDNHLRPESYMNVKILPDHNDEPVLTIPRSAIIRLADVNYTIQALSDNRFIAQKIKLGKEGVKYAQVLEGLNRGDTVVTSGQFLIDSETNVRSGIKRNTINK